MSSVGQAEIRWEVEAFSEWVRMRNFWSCVRQPLLGS